LAAVFNLQIRIVPVTPLQQNCSLIWRPQTKRAALIDPGGDIDRLMGALDHFDLSLTRIWLTHGHFDHAGAAAELRERTGVKVEGPHKDDQFWLDRAWQDGRRYGLSGVRNLVPDSYFEDGQVLDFEGERFMVAHTPGHTPGARRYLQSRRQACLCRRCAVCGVDWAHRFSARQPSAADRLHHRKALAVGRGNCLCAGTRAALYFRPRAANQRLRGRSHHRL